MATGVGIIGVAPGRSWAALAHIPALQALPDYEIRALSTTRQESASAAAAEFGIARAYDNHHALVNDPDVDLVAVTVKVPHHRALVTAAIAAGKHVYCEWPLGNGLAEAEAMAALAKDKGVIGAVGLQARSAPALRYLRDLVTDGYVGTVLSSTLVGSGMNWGAFIDQPNAYTADKANGATLLTIPFGHTIDAVAQCLGEFASLQAITANRRDHFTLVEDGAQYPMTAEDQVLIAGTLAGGATMAVHYRGGFSRGTNFRWEINGTDGDIVATADAGHAQMFPITLIGARGDDQQLAPLPVPADYKWTPASVPPFAENVAQAYALLASDLRDGTSHCPTFADAVRRHRLIDAVERAAASGERVSL
ncbi:Gfo/Idh/MocA family oxidoreductase [Sphingobium sp.]|uniref:Gfo/Idh/MocA family protein n=1 Tax=Sphingobium sp. TaxID=1912891 RepID=UPI002C560096|nr:Gfo/Idh/MocA family oxidoreductase [Sphingobium sp.]HUD93313.1 Gfo/Idh/MocA family oxidoreductase [Sphingobium sp.]